MVSFLPLNKKAKEELAKVILLMF